jgi:hypothetical protein
MKIKMSKSQWTEMGRKAGWIKKSQNLQSLDNTRKYKLVDLHTYETLDIKRMTHQEHVESNRSLKDSGFNQRWERIREDNQDN